MRLVGPVLRALRGGGFGSRVEAVYWEPVTSVTSAVPRASAARVAVMAPVALIAATSCRAVPARGLDASVAADGQDASVAADAGGLAPSALGVHVRRAAPLRPRSAPGPAGTTIDVAGASFAAGSAPGDDGRDPTLEPAGVVVTLGGFRIDALPFPNDPERPPAVARSQDDAQRACAGRGARLCNELEWERACRGPDDDPYPSGAAWDGACDGAPSTCASGFGVRAMGSVREWTSSVIARGAGREPALRGASAAEGRARSTAHRCARRSRLSAPVVASPSAGGSDVGFRCCDGPDNDAAIAAIAATSPFGPADLDAPALAAALARSPDLARLGGDVRFFDARDRAAASSGEASGAASFAPVAWSPEAGSSLVVAAGRAGKSSFVVALWATGRVAASYVFLEDPVWITIASDPHRPRELTWLARGGSAPQSGHVRLADDHAVLIESP